MHVALDFDKGTATMTTSEFWSGLNDLLAQADAHPIDSRDEDSGHLHRDRDAYLVGEHLEIGKPLWPLIERDICRDAALDAKLRHAYEIREAGGFEDMGPIVHFEGKDMPVSEWLDLVTDRVPDACSIKLLVKLEDGLAQITPC